MEQKYIEEHATINKNLAEVCTSNNINGIQKSFLDYVGLTDTFKPFRREYIEKLKVQREELIKFRVKKSLFRFFRGSGKTKIILIE